MNKEQENQADIEKKANEEKLQLQIKGAASDVVQHCRGKKTEMKNLIDKFEKRLG